MNFVSMQGIHKHIQILVSWLRNVWKMFITLWISQKVKISLELQMNHFFMDAMVHRT